MIDNSAFPLLCTELLRVRPREPLDGILLVLSATDVAGNTATLKYLFSPGANAYNPDSNARRGSLNFQPDSKYGNLITMWTKSVWHHDDNRNHEFFNPGNAANPFNNQRDALNRGDGVRTSQWGYLGASLRLTPGTGLSFDARASYDTLFSNLVSHSLSLGSFREPVQVAATWYESFDPRTGSRSSSQVRTMVGFRQQANASSI